MGDRRLEIDQKTEKKLKFLLKEKNTGVEFRRQLEYKQLWNGGNVIAINPKNTSRKCAACGHVSADNRTTQSNFRCVACGFADNADINAAQNILAAGHAVLACGELIRPKLALAVSVKQKPTERAAQAA